MTSKKKIIFMGTPEFAAPTLRALIQTCEVSAVFTSAPKPSGRGMKVQLTPVNVLAAEHNIPVHTPKTLRNEDAINLINSIEADLIVVCAYGFIIPKNILEAKKYGCINLHPSKLPRFRGASPLQHTIIEGDKSSAICVMQMDEGLDTGPILLREDFDLPNRPTLKFLHDYAASRGAEMVAEVVLNIENMTGLTQSDIGMTYAHKLSKENSYIDWNWSAEKIDCKIRGYAAWPGSFFKATIGERSGEDIVDIKVIDAEPLDNQGSKELPGYIISRSPLVISCGVGVDGVGTALRINMLQAPGKKPMSAEEFLRGNKLSAIAQV